MGKFTDWLFRRPTGTSEHGTPLKLIPRGWNEVFDHGRLEIQHRDREYRCYDYYSMLEGGRVAHESFGFGWSGSGSMLLSDAPRAIRPWLEYQQQRKSEPE